MFIETAECFVRIKEKSRVILVKSLAIDIAHAIIKVI